MSRPGYRMDERRGEDEAAAVYEEILRLNPNDIAGGEDQAWLYRQDMRETWLATPDALEYLRALPKPAARRRRRSRRRDR